MSKPSPVTLVVFGISGDLAARKIIPALYWLTAAGKLPERFSVIGLSRREVTAEGLVEAARPHINHVDPAVLGRVRDSLQLIRMDSTQSDQYQEVLAQLDVTEQGDDDAVRVLHVAVPPIAAKPIISALAENKLIGGDQKARLLLEKPFGYDLESALDLEAFLHEAAREGQIYRIDHYLAKTDVVAVTNRSFDPKKIERVEAELTEAHGVGNRADFWEQTGALRDLLQSHLIAMAATVVAKSEGDEFRRERELVTKALELTQAERGQYTGYREEVANSDSVVETYAKLELHASVPGWEKIPLVLIAGIGFGARTSEIRVYERGKKEPIVCKLRYGDAADLNREPDSYERVLSDAIAGDKTNFSTGEEILATWRLLDPVLRSWERDDDGMQGYPKDTRPV